MTEASSMTEAQSMTQRLRADIEAQSMTDRVYSTKITKGYLTMFKIKKKS